MTARPLLRIRLWTGLWLALGLGAIAVLLHVPLLSVPLLLGVATSYVCEPLLVRWESRGYTRATGLLLIGTVFVAGIALGGAWLTHWLRHDAAVLLADAPDTANRIEASLAAMFTQIETALGLQLGPGDAFWADLGERLQERWLPTAPMLVLKLLIGLLLVPTIAFFLLRDGRRLTRRVLEAVPNLHFEMTLNILHRINKETGAYLRGVLLEAILVGLTAASVGMLVGLDHVAVIGVAVGITNLVPYAGPLAGGLIGALYLTTLGILEQQWALLLAAVVTAQLADNVLIGPGVLGRAVNVHPLLVIALLLAGGRLFGILGLLVAVPLWVVIRVVVQEVAVATRAYGRYVREPSTRPAAAAGGPALDERARAG